MKILLAAILAIALPISTYAQYVVTNLAHSPTALATQSSTCMHGPADLAIDGNTSGIWNEGSVSTTCSDRPEPQWWMVDLMHNHYGLKVIASVVLYNHGVQHLDDAYVQILDANQKVIANEPIDMTYGWRVQTFNFDNVEGKYVRIKRKSLGSLNLGEVEVLGWTKPAENTYLRRV